MDFRITEEQQLLLESIDQFIDQAKAKGFDRDYFMKLDNKMGYPLEYMQFLMESGLGLIGIPEKYGGTEVDLLTMCLVAERFGRRGYPNALGSALSIDDMLTFGSEEQIEFVSSQIMTGKGGFSLGITEPGAGSDNSSMITTAKHVDGQVVINGCKSFITNGDLSKYFLLVCREAEPEDPKLWASMYFVPVDAPGVSTTPMHKIGWRTAGNMCEVRLDNVVVPESALVGKKGYGFIQLMKNFEIERLVMCVNALGIAENAMDIAAAYASERIAFGKPIGSFQLIQEMLTECECKIINMQNFCYRTAWEKDNGVSIRLNVNLAKYYVCRAACEVVDDCLQIMGGIGYIEDCDLSKLYRDIRAYRIGAGTDQIMIHISGRLILKKYAK